jgi:hypothetical protein
LVSVDEYNVRYNRIQVSKALLTAGRLLKGPVCPAARIAEVLNPYMDCTEVGGVSGQLHDDIRSSIFAVMGDAYRREGNVQLAAQWYRRASVISSGGHATVFAHMVCNHRLADFYGDALASLEEHQRRWLAKPIIARILLRMVGWCRRTDPEGREMARREKAYLEFLRQHALAKAA